MVVVLQVVDSFLMFRTVLSFYTGIGRLLNQFSLTRYLLFLLLDYLSRNLSIILIHIHKFSFVFKLIISFYVFFLLGLP